MKISVVARWVEEKYVYNLMTKDLYGKEVSLARVWLKSNGKGNPSIYGWEAHGSAGEAGTAGTAQALAIVALTRDV